ncbi:FAD-dependent monooxygenase [Streptomyces sp. NPDC056661]|uniref:FAD-dependent monooxygenase n=1 Tax=Streptomyces sp. NPDC056661 TaxID=3345898 RepID=UPI0036A947DA
MLLSHLHALGAAEIRFATELVAMKQDANGVSAIGASPRGGTGLNTAIQDAYDLGWKLAWVLRGWAGPELLDTYGTDRRAFAEHNVTRSADPDGSLREANDVLPVDLGVRIAHLWVHRDGERSSTMDLLGPGFTVFTGPAGLQWRKAARECGELVPMNTQDVGKVAVAALGVRGSGALLVRPDGMPVALWPAGDANAPDALRQAMRTTLGRDDGGDPKGVWQAMDLAADVGHSSSAFEYDISWGSSHSDPLPRILHL